MQVFISGTPLENEGREGLNSIECNNLIVEPWNQIYMIANSIKQNTILFADDQVILDKTYREEERNTYNT